jgi:hypothetical protein
MPLACPSFIAAIGHELCRTVDAYCERQSAAIDAEPLNAITGAAMLISAAAAAYLQVKRPNHDAAVAIWSAIAAISVGAIGATLFHTFATVWAVALDVIPFLVFMLIILWLTMTRFFNWTWPGAILAVAGFLGAIFFAGRLMPAGASASYSYYLVPLIVLLIASIALKLRRSPAADSYLAATIVFVAAIVSRESDGPLCASVPVGTHFLWHLFAALLAFILIRAAILHAPRKLSGKSP